MTNKKKAKWELTEAQQNAFDIIKYQLTSAPVLACPDRNKTFILQTDANNIGLGVALTQRDENAERMIAYASRMLRGAEKIYSATELECLAVK